MVAHWTEGAGEWFPVSANYVNYMKTPRARLDNRGRNGVHFTQLNYSCKCDEGIMRLVRAFRESAVGGSRWADGDAVSCQSRLSEKPVRQSGSPVIMAGRLMERRRVAAPAAIRVVPRFDICLIVPKHRPFAFELRAFCTPGESINTFHRRGHHEDHQAD